MAAPVPSQSRRLSDADACRRTGRWREALEHYLYAERYAPDDAALKHNIALCHMSLGRASPALVYCDAALAVNPSLWQSAVVKAKALKELGRVEAAFELLQRLLAQHPMNAEVRLELAALALHQLGDAAFSQRIVQPLLADPEYRPDAALTDLMARLYDREGSAEELTRDICAFARDSLVIPWTLRPAPGHGGQRRTRVGLISPQFCCSPIYFFCIGALRELAGAVDLVVFDRGRKRDAATAEFAALATAWFDVPLLDSEALAAFLQKQNLDVLLDLGGWMDPPALRALSTKPARRMVKWVGGQAATTGIAAFDGMLSDEYQTPPWLQHLYVEPLLLLKGGYVTYTPPAYLPAPVPAHAGTMVVGIISNPAKISCAFLLYLREQLSRVLRRHPGSVVLRFIDRRYAYGAARKRIRAMLQGDGEASGSIADAIEFIVPQDHLSYLREVAKLSAVIDTFPYTGGLTSVEALALGVPCYTRAGALFCERHTFSHCTYAGMALCRSDLEPWLLDGFMHGSRDKHGDAMRTTLVSRASQRLDHRGLAQELCRQLHL
jgi:protein O-GlcNAc transferase